MYAEILLLATTVTKTGAHPAIPSMDNSLLEYNIRSKTGWNVTLTPLSKNKVQNSYSLTSTLQYIYCTNVRQRAILYLYGWNICSKLSTIRRPTNFIDDVAF
jgi:hypothetical protein